LVDALEEYEAWIIRQELKDEVALSIATGTEAEATDSG